MRDSVGRMGAAQSFRRIFVANRGEVAARVARTCDLMGITPVFGVSIADRDAPWVRGREHVVLGPARSSESYLNIERVVQAARQSRCSAVHPGWGFLAENPLFSAMCEQHGMRFIGPSAAVMELMGQKIPAKRAMVAGMPAIASLASATAQPNTAEVVLPSVRATSAAGLALDAMKARSPHKPDG